MITEVLEKIEGADLTKVNLFYILRNKAGENINYRVSGVKIDSTISEYFKDSANEFMEKKLEDNDNDIEYLNYEPDISIERNIVLTIAKSEVDVIEEYLEKLEDLDNMEDSSSLKQKNLWGYIVHFADIDLYMFKKFGSAKISMKSKGFMNALIQDGVLNSIEDDMIVFDNKIDCILYEDQFLIFNKGNFEKVFDFFEKMFQIVEENIYQLKDKGLLQDTDRLYKHCKNDSRKIKKLKNILDSDLLDLIDKNKFNELNDRFSLGLEFDEEGNISMNEEKTWQILALLNDDYLDSDLTSVKYEVQGKIKK